MARVRMETYTNFAWPAALGRLYRNNGLTVALAPEMASIDFFGAKGYIVHSAHSRADAPDFTSLPDAVHHARRYRHSL